MPRGDLTVRRLVLDKPVDWLTSSNTLSTITVLSEGTIEDSSASFHVDFANEYIGGGVLTGGCVQEEILFLIKPECIATLLFCPKMEDREAIVIIGAERYSKYAGYGSRFTWVSEESPIDITIVDKSYSFQGRTLHRSNSTIFQRYFSKRNHCHRRHCLFRSWLPIRSKNIL
jgi:hypothetical protein